MMTRMTTTMPWPWPSRLCTSCRWAWPDHAGTGCSSYSRAFACRGHIDPALHTRHTLSCVFRGHSRQIHHIHGRLASTYCECRICCHHSHGTGPSSSCEGKSYSLHIPRTCSSASCEGRSDFLHTAHSMSQPPRARISRHPCSRYTCASGGRVRTPDSHRIHDTYSSASGVRKCHPPCNQGIGTGPCYARTLHDWSTLCTDPA